MTTSFACEKRPATGAGGMVVTNHPLGSAAGYEVMAAGGNAADAAVAALLALCVVEPMMVGIAGGGMAHVRSAAGAHEVVDGMAAAPAATHPEIFEPVSDEPPDHMETVGRRSALGPTAVAVPGNLAAWCLLHERHGRLPFPDVVEPALRLARRGFVATPYLEGAVGEAAADLARDPAIAALFLPGGRPIRAGDRLVQGDFAEALALVARDGAAALHGGPLGAALAGRVATGEAPGWLTEADLARYRPRLRPALRGTYRGHEVVGPPPPASSGVHVAQMLNLLEPHDVRGLGFGTVDGLHLMAEVIRVGFEDRRRASGDPDFVAIPVERLMSKAAARAAQARLRDVARPAPPPAGAREGADTTHVTVADRDGLVVSATHTINGIFGARFLVPGTGIIPNNYMMNFDPHPGRALSVAPGKRVPTSMAPMMVLRDGRIRYALGLPGGLRIFPSALQAIVALLDHGMTLQAAVEAPRIWTEGHVLEVERAFAPLAPALERRGHDVRVVPHIGGGMNAVAWHDDGTMEGAACWRADGTVAALGGGQARPGVRFWPGRTPEDGDGDDGTAPR